MQRLERLFPIPSMRLNARLTIFLLFNKIFPNFLMMFINFAPKFPCQVIIYLLSTFFKKTFYLFSPTKTLIKICAFLLVLFKNFGPGNINELTKPLFPYPLNNHFQHNTSFRFWLIIRLVSK